VKVKNTSVVLFSGVSCHLTKLFHGDGLRLVGGKSVHHP